MDKPKRRGSFLNNTRTQAEEGKQKTIKQTKLKASKGITLIALVIMIMFSYDEKLKCSNSKGFLLAII